MKELKELTRVVTKNKVKRIEIIGDINHSKSLIHQLYTGIVEGKYNSDKEAEQDLYGQEGGETYKKLKLRLKQSLQGRFASTSAFHLAEKLYRKSIEFELTDITVLTLRDMIGYLKVRTSDYKKITYYQNLLDHYLKLLSKEHKVDNYSTSLLILNYDYRIGLPEKVRRAEKYERKIRKIFKKYDSFKLKDYGYKALTRRYEMLNDYKGLLGITLEAANYFEKKERAHYRLAIARFLYRAMICYIQLRNYKEGEQAALKCISLTDNGSNNWLLYHAYYLMLYFHSSQYEKAYSIYKKCRFHPNFKKLFPRAKELWLSLEAYIQYLIQIKKIGVPEEEQKSFRLRKFLNEVPLFSKDKRNSNIPILILHMLFLLHQKKYEKVYDRVQALEKYTTRYLKAGDSFRSNCFIKMLLQLPKCHYHKQAVIRKTKQLKVRMSEVPINVASQGSETEYIPYETLWEFVLDSLEDKFYYINY